LAALPVALTLIALIYYPQPCCAPAMRTAQLLQLALYKSRIDRAYTQEVAEHPNARYVLFGTDGGFSNEIGFAKAPFGDPSLEDTHGEHLSTYHIYGPYYFWSD
jgi:hypothetical protein